MKRKIIFVLLSLLIPLSLVLVNKGLSYKVHQEVLQKVSTIVISPRYNENHYIYVDFSRPLNEERLFIMKYDNGRSSIEWSALVSHGNGKGNTSTRVVTSNTINSHCSSEGIYRLGRVKPFGKGKCIELDGLSSTNSNARVRGIYIHSCKYLRRMPKQYFFNIPLKDVSHGCIVTDPSTNQKIIELVNHSKKPILMYVSL